MSMYNRHTLLSTLEHDVNVSVTEKTAAFKLLQTILKNLVASPTEAKFRQLRLSNPKIQSMTRHTCLLQYLQMTIGFQTTQNAEGQAILQIPDALVLDATLMQEAYSTAQTIYQRLAAQCPTLTKSSSSVSTTSSSTSSLPLSEKQKARLLAEQKEAAEKEEARQARKRTAAQIKIDKHVRQTDENWKPSVSAAAAKAGDAMTTFRDKFGEN
uniref:PUB domain-containing protein n=1 Tax=Entomoneis paludosa TaxID=265537 RepID=A0A7S2YT59_9STRA|mmetsp:Transcript_879/g.2072  ORF Transcript_879/g.2072 Transcript_879/m.2072 type:complete len:212 (+) Transcript_879:119-754(+)